MIRSLALAAAVAFGLTAIPAGTTPAKADTDVYLNLGIPDGYKRSGDGWRRGDKYHQLSCRQARQILRNRGWRDIITRSCSGRTYQFRAFRGGQPREIGVNSRTGNVFRL